jgi:molybdenum cofactor biosynthesis enzyme MoaA
MSQSIKTFSIVAGSMACNARCQFCVAGMTPANGIGTKEPAVNWRNFRKAAQYARDGSCSTAMITSKGEPTIFPDQISKFLEELKPFNFPVIEMQTNGLLIAEGKKVTDAHLKAWYENGLTTVAISVVHYDAAKNKEVYTPHKPSYIDLPALIKKLHDFGFGVRLAVVMVKGYLDTVEEIAKMIDFARTNKVEQLTIRPVTKPEESESEGAAIFKYTMEHHVDNAFIQKVNDMLLAGGHVIEQLAFGATVYDYKGQNVCMTNCLTVGPAQNELRQVIFFPDGHLRYAWQYSGAIIF